MAPFNIVPCDSDFGDVDVVLASQVEKLDVERPALQMLCWEDALRGIPREDLEAALGVLVSKPKDEVDEHVHARVEELPDASALDIFLASIPASDRNSKTLA